MVVTIVVTILVTSSSRMSPAGRQLLLALRELLREQIQEGYRS